MTSPTGHRDAVATAAAIRSGELTAREAVEDAIARPNDVGAEGKADAGEGLHRRGRKAIEPVLGIADKHASGAAGGKVELPRGKSRHIRVHLPYGVENLFSRKASYRNHARPPQN